MKQERPAGRVATGAPRRLALDPGGPVAGRVRVAGSRRHFAVRGSEILRLLGEGAAPASDCYLGQTRTGGPPGVTSNTP
jgi:hypothetical protein